MKKNSKYIKDFLQTLTLAYLIPLIHFPVRNHMYDYYITKNDICGVYRFVWFYGGLIPAVIIFSIYLIKLLLYRKNHLLFQILTLLQYYIFYFSICLIFFPFFTNGKKCLIDINDAVSYNAWNFNLCFFIIYGLILVSTTIIVFLSNLLETSSKRMLEK